MLLPKPATYESNRAITQNNQYCRLKQEMMKRIVPYVQIQTIHTVA